MKKISFKLIQLFLCLCFIRINALPWFNKTSILDLTTENSNIEVSEAMTYEESVMRYAELNNTSYSDALNKFPIKQPVTRSSRFTSRELIIRLDVSDSYKPSLHFLCETSEGSSSYWGILNIYSAQLVKSYNNKSYKFDGVVEFWLRSAYQIEYVVNGDLHYNYVESNEGTFSGTVTLKGKGSFSSSVTGTSSSWYTYFYDHKLKDFQ